MRKLVSLIVLALLALLLTSACGGGGEPAPTPTAELSPEDTPAPTSAPQPQDSATLAQAVADYIGTAGFDGSTFELTDPAECLDIEDAAAASGKICIAFENSEIGATTAEVEVQLVGSVGLTAFWKLTLALQEGAWIVTDVAFRPAAEEPEAIEPAGEFEGSRDPVERAAVSEGTGLLVDVRVAQHEAFDRVVFEFAGALPGYRVEYVLPAPPACGSGLAVEVGGEALLQVRMSPAAAHDDAGMTTFELQELTLGLSAILEAEQTCDLEGVLTWVLGLSEEADFTVVDLTDPFRVVVDVAYP